MTPPLIEAHDLTATFPSPDDGAPVQVLGGVSLRLDHGEMVSIVGPSGSGKSTLLYCLSGLYPATSGTVDLLGRRLSTLRRGQLAELRRGRVGFVFQSYNLIPSLSARENVALPARLARRRLSEADIDQALAQVGLADRGGHRPSALSGGQQQRVAIARVLAAGPDVVFADEPTGALDTAAGDQVLDLLRTTAAGPRSVVLVTHDVTAAARADRVLVLRDGLVSRELIRPTPEQVFQEMSTADPVG
jgi:putative ABC transport system ATP-binding protein